MNNVLPLYPDAEPKIPRCSACGDSGLVYHPVTVVSHMDTYFSQEKREVVEVPVKTVCGGIDACPECTARAEAEYKDRTK